MDARLASGCVWMVQSLCQSVAEITLWLLRKRQAGWHSAKQMWRRGFIPRRGGCTCKDGEGKGWGRGEWKAGEPRVGRESSPPIAHTGTATRFKRCRVKHK